MGALGISKRNWAMGGRTLRIAISIPPALTLRAVANSKNSFPFASRLRTKTGMASGNRAHLRRSVSWFEPFMRTSASPFLRYLEAHTLPKAPCTSVKTSRKPRVFGDYYPESRTQPSFTLTLFALCSAERRRYCNTETARKCRVLLHLGNSVSFFIDKPDGVSYDFDYRDCN